MTHDNDEPKAAHPWAVLEGERPLFHVPSSYPPEYGADATLEPLWRAKQPLKAPFPYFGGKSKIATQVWQRFGVVQNYVEPFFGSGAVLLSCPHPRHTETVNDADGLLANFWRATQYDPEAVAAYADWPVNEADLHARHRWLVDRRSMVEQLMSNPEWFDAQAAGWWVWGISQWIGTGWCPSIPASISDMRELPIQLPHIGDAGMGIHRASDAHALAQKRPAIGGRGRPSSVGRIHRKELSQQMPEMASSRGGLRDLTRRMPHLGGEYALPSGVFAPRMEGALYDYFRALSARLRRTRVVCGDFERILGPSVTWRHGMTAVFLDPPYVDAEHAVTYSGGMNVWARATKWCEENGAHPQMRIALCGYADTWEAPHGWEMIRWRTAGGYGSQGNARGRANANREAIWFSPACLNPADVARDRLSQPIVVGESDYSDTMFDFAEEDA